MKQKILSIFLIVVLIIAFTNFSNVYSENQSEIEKAVNYLKSQSQTPWSTMALVANGETGINLSHLESVPSEQKSPTTYAKYILALIAASKNPTDFGDEDYIEKLKSYYQNNQFGEENLINDDFWAILALGSIGQEKLSMVQEAKEYILNNQNLDGGWGYNLSSSDTNDTAAAIIALLEAGVSSSSLAIQNALSYLKSAQNDDGGFPYLLDSSSDSCSDAWIISTIYKLGQDPTSSDWTKNGKNPLDHLKSLQDEDGGFWWQTEGDNKFCSPYALLSLLGKSYPVETDYNKHSIRIEGQQNTICDTQVNGGTVMDLIISGAKVCDYGYSIVEYPGIGLYLAELAGESSWMYMVNNVSPMLGADNYFLSSDDGILWFSGEWLDGGWFPTKVELTKTENLIEIQVKSYDTTNNQWQNLKIEGIKVKIGSSEFTTDNQGKIETSPNILEEGFYQVFVENQVIQGVGYIRSEKAGLKIGITPSEHKTGLRVEIEKVEAPPEGEQATISFSVEPDLLDFGKLKPGESASSSLTITNGEIRIYLEAEVNGASVFQENLEIDERFWQFFSTEIKASQSKVLPVQLNIPGSYTGDFGLLEGDITFWAIKK